MHPNLPAWVQTHKRAGDQETYIYMDPMDLPKELQPLSVGLLPMDMNDAAFGENMDNMYPSIPNQWRLWALLPFPIYTDLLSVMAMLPEVLPPLPRERKVRLAETIASSNDTRNLVENRYMHHTTLTVFDLYTRLVTMLVWLRAHRTFRVDEERAKSLERASKICESRLKSAKKTLSEGAKALPGVYELMLRLREPGAHIVSFYSEALADSFEPLLFRYAVSVLRIHQHQVLDLCMIDPKQAEQNGLLVSEKRPPVEHLCDAVIDVMKVHVADLSREFGSPETPKEECFYDTAHIAKVQAETPPGRMNRSMLFQTLVCVVAGKAPVAGRDLVPPPQQ
jgi:hypothetical protein